MTTPSLFIEHPPESPPAGRFAAIDFETADNGRDSACAIGIAVSDGLDVVEQAHFLIRPPRRRFLHTGVHGITWQHVADQPAFAEVWARVMPLLAGVEFVAAHNAPFDRGVLHACCQMANLAPPPHQFRCSVQVARKVWALPSVSLPVVCRHLGIELRHHDAMSDAHACARIILAAKRIAPHVFLPPKPRESGKGHTRWTDADDARLRLRVSEGASVSVLVEEFGRAPGGIRSRLKKLGL